MSETAVAQQIERLQLELDDQREVAQSWFRKYCENQRRLEEYGKEIGLLQTKLGKTLHELGAAEALNAEAAKAGPIVDDRIKELEAALVESRQACVSLSNALSGHIAVISELSAERDRYKREFEESHLQCRNLRNQMRQAQADAVAAYIEEHGPDPQPAETELERRAWELFVRQPYVTADESFRHAIEWMAHRDDRRKAGAA